MYFELKLATLSEDNLLDFLYFKIMYINTVLHLNTMFLFIILIHLN